MAEFLADRGLDTAGFQLAFAPEHVPAIVAECFVSPATTLQQLRPALAQIESLQFRHPDQPWPAKRAPRPVLAREPAQEQVRFSTFLRSEIAHSPVTKAQEEKKKAGGPGLLERMGSRAGKREEPRSSADTMFAAPTKAPEATGMYHDLVVDVNALPMPADEDEVQQQQQRKAPASASPFKQTSSDAAAANADESKSVSFLEKIGLKKDKAKAALPDDDESSKSEDKIVATYGDDRRKRGDMVVADAISEAPEQEYSSEPVAPLVTAPPPVAAQDDEYEIGPDGSVRVKSVKPATGSKNVYSELIVPVPESNVTRNVKPAKEEQPLVDRPRSRNPRLDRLQDVVETAQAKDKSEGAASKADESRHHAVDAAAAEEDKHRRTNPTLDRLQQQTAHAPPSSEVAAGHHKEPARNPRLERLMQTVKEDDDGETTPMAELGEEAVAEEHGVEVRPGSAPAAAAYKSSLFDRIRRDEPAAAAGGAGGGKAARRGSILRRLKSRPEAEAEEVSRRISWGNVQVQLIDSNKTQMQELAARRRAIEEGLKASNEQIVKVKFPESFPLAAKRFVLSHEQTVQEACDTITETMAGRGIGHQGFELGIPRAERARPQVQEALRALGIGNQVVFLERQKLVGAYKPLLSVLEYVDFIPPPSFLFEKPAAPVTVAAAAAAASKDEAAGRAAERLTDELFDYVDEEGSGSGSGSLRGGRGVEDTDEDAADDDFDDHALATEERELRAQQQRAREQRLQALAALPPPPSPPTVETFSMASYVNRALAEPEAADVLASGRGRGGVRVPAIGRGGMAAAQQQQLAVAAAATAFECEGCGTKNSPTAKKCKACEAPTSGWGFGGSVAGGGGSPPKSARQHQRSNSDGSAVSQWMDAVEAGREEGPRLSFPWSGESSKVFVGAVAPAGRGRDEGAEPPVSGRGRGRREERGRGGEAPLGESVAERTSERKRVAPPGGSLRGMGRGGGLDAAPSGRGHRRTLSGPSANVSMQKWLDAAVRAEVSGRGRGLDAPPTAAASGGRGSSGQQQQQQQREALRRDVMNDWLQQALNAETAGRGRGRECAPGRGRGVAMSGWMDQASAPVGRGEGGLDAPPTADRGRGEREALRQREEMPSAGRGEGGLEAPPVAGRGKVERGSLSRGTMKNWMDQAAASPAGRGEGGLDAPPVAGRGTVKRESLSKVPMGDWMDQASSPAGRGEGGLEAAPGAGRGKLRGSIGKKSGAMSGWLDQAGTGEGAGRGSGLAEAPAGRGREQRKSLAPAAGMDRWLDSLFVPGGRGRGGLLAPPAAGRAARRSSGGSDMEKDVLAAVPLPAKEAEAPAARPEALAALLQESRRPGKKQTLRATLPVLVVFPAYLGVESKMAQVPARLTVAGAIDYLAKLHGGHFSAAGVGLRVGEEYQFEDAFSRSELFPFLDPQKPLQWYEEVITTTPLYWERFERGGEPRGESGEELEVKVVFPSKMGLAPVTARLRPGMSVTDAEAAVVRVVGLGAGRVMRLGVPLELQHLPEVALEIVKLGMRESPEYPHFAHGRMLAEYADLLASLDYVEMS